MVLFMPKKYYLDTCIWLDYWENRKNKFRPLGEWAFEVIKNIDNEGGFILFSQKVKEELEEKYSYEKIKKIISIIPNTNIIFIMENTRQLRQAVKLARTLKIPRGDALHAILAREYDAVLVTRDKHFLELSCIIKVKKPEDLI